ARAERDVVEKEEDSVTGDVHCLLIAVEIAGDKLISGACRVRNQYWFPVTVVDLQLGHGDIRALDRQAGVAAARVRSIYRGRSRDSEGLGDRRKRTPESNGVVLLEADRLRADLRVGERD